MFLLQENLTDTDIEILERWQAAEIQLYADMSKQFQHQIDAFGRDKMNQEVLKLQSIRQKLKRVCDVQEYNPETNEKRIKKKSKKYSYSVPFNRNVIHYISG